MLFSTRTATIFFAISLLGWGIMHFMLGDFIAGRAPAFPEGLPGKVIWAWISGLILIVTAISIVTNRKTRLTATCAGLLIIVWAGGRNVYIVLSTLDYGAVLTSTGKAITIGFGTLLVAAIFSDTGKDSQWTDKILRYAFLLTCISIGIFFIIGGIQHFLFIDFVKTLVPSWIPGAAFWSYLAGVALIATGISLITGIQRKLAALLSAWMIYIWLLILHVPRGFGETGNFNEWIAIFEALAVPALLTLIYWKEKRQTSSLS